MNSPNRREYGSLRKSANERAFYGMVRAFSPKLNLWAEKVAITILEATVKYKHS